MKNFAHFLKYLSFYCKNAVKLKAFYRFFIQNNKHFPCILRQNVYNRNDEYIKLLMEVNETNVQNINTEIKR